MKTNPNRLWVIVLVLGWAFDFLFWRQSWGVNFAIFAILCLTGAFYLLWNDGLWPKRASLFLLPLFIFFAAVTFIRAEPMTAFLSFTFTLLTMTILTFTYLGGRWMEYSIADYVGKSLALVGDMIGRPLLFTVDARKAQAETGTQPAKFNLWPVLRGVLIALPVVAVFGSLLASADVVFGQRFKDFIELFKLENLPEYIFRSMYILVIAYALAGVILNASLHSKDEKLVGQEKPLVPAFLGFIESTIVLGSVAALFAVFVVIQFQYFFGGHTNINVEGFTYSEYAVKGFGELVFTAFLSLAMLLGLTSITKRETEFQRQVYSGLGVMLVGLLLVMLFSAYQRLGLYEAVYGYSRLRTYTHVSLYWIGLLLVTTIVLEIVRRERYFTFALLVACFGFAISLPVLNVDAFIVNQNIKREVDGVALGDENRVDLDAQYFVQLSEDAIPVLVSTFQDKSTPADVKEKVGAALACIRHDNARVEDESSWQSFHFARYNAQNALASIEKDLDQFKVTAEDWPTIVTTPAGQDFSCSEYYYD